MLNKKRLKITVNDYKKLIEKDGPNFDLYKYVSVYGELYIEGLYLALNKILPCSRAAFLRERDYKRYMNGYNNGKHLRKYLQINY